MGGLGALASLGRRSGVAYGGGFAEGAGTAGGAGAVGGVRGGLSRGVGRVVGVGSLAIPASAIAGGAIGGRSGAAITGAGIGASVGAFGGPIGALIGGAAGFTLGAVTQKSSGQVKELQAFTREYKQLGAALVAGKVSASQFNTQVAALNAHLRTEGFSSSAGKAKQFAQSVRMLNSDIGALRQGSATSLTDLRNRFNQNMTDIAHLMGARSKDGRRAMDQNMNAAFQNLRSLLNDGKDHTSKYLGQIKSIFQSDFQATGRITKSNLDSVVAAIKQGMADGSINAKKGLQAIHDYSIQYLGTTFGIHGQDAEVALKKGGVSGAVSASGGPHAVGGWIGSPGQAGRDTVPIMAGAGEFILNRHQQRPVEAAMRTVYGMGLDELAAKVSRPHYMAAGGPITVSGTPFGVEGVEDIATLRDLASVANQRLGAIGQQERGPGVGPGGFGKSGSARANPRLAAFDAAEAWANPSESPWLPGGVHPVHAHYGPADHYSGGATDFGVTGGRALALIQQVYAWERAGKLQEWGPGIIWQGPGAVHPGAAPPGTHLDHVHVSAHARGGWVDPHRRGHWSVQDVVGLLYIAGMRDRNAIARLAAKTVGESGGDSSNVGDGGDSIGLFQIDTAFNNYPKSKLYDPLYNARAAINIYRSQGIGAWHAPDGPVGTARRYANLGAAYYLSGGTGSTVSMYDDRTLRKATHPQSYWDHMRKRYPRAFAHYHKTLAQAKAARKRSSSVAASAPAAAADRQSSIPEDFYAQSDLDLARAGTTPDTADDEYLKGLRRLGDYAAIKPIEDRLDFRKRLLAAGKTMFGTPLSPADRADLVQAIGQDTKDLTALYGDIASNAPAAASDQASSDQTARDQLQQQIADLLSQQVTNQQRIIRLAQVESGTMQAALVAAVSGDLGERVSRGSATPSAAGSLASY
jgi:hypothetical protein